MSPELAPGTRVVVEVGAVAHGGHCVARHEGRVMFLRHALPGEQVLVEVTQLGRRGRFLRADVVEVLRSSPDRRPAPCPVARSCGGCDWQHASPGAVRHLKAQVVREALARFAEIELAAGFGVLEIDGPTVEGAPRPPAGLGWRTRGMLSADHAGRPGFKAHRSNTVVVAGQCLQLHSRLDPLDLFDRRWPAGSRVGFVAPSADDPAAFDAAEPPTAPITERAAGRTWSVAADGFWQVHPGAADALVAEVSGLLDPRPGERLVDLYAGVGLFGLSLATRTDGAPVTLVEGDRRACALARVNAGGVRARIVHANVLRWVTGTDALAGADLVVLDPPRTGAGSQVTGAITAARPRAVAYVACDPVALARDVATFSEDGYELRHLVAMDLFPTTHHVECVALLTPRVIS